MKTVFSPFLSFILVFNSFGQYESKQTQTVSPVFANFNEIAAAELANPPVRNIKTKSKKSKLNIPPFEMPNQGVQLFEGEPKSFTNAVGILGPSPSPSTQFDALISDGTSIPPDVNGAAGPNHVITTLNTDVRIQNRTGTVISTVTNNNFYPNEQTTSVYDPKVLYDSFTQRFYVVYLDGSSATTSNILIAVSQTNNPTGTWNYYRIQTNVGDPTLWLDYPSIGFNKDWLVVSGNMFTNAGSFSKAKLFVVKKSDILAGTATTPTEISVATGFTLAPAVVYDNTTTTIPLVGVWNHTTGTYKIWRINGVPPTTPTLTDVGFPSVGSGNKWFAYTAFYNQAPQLGMTSATDGMDDGDHRMANVVLRNGKLWAVHNSFFTNTGTEVSTAIYRGVVRWLSINPSTAAINEWGKIEDTGVTNMGTFSVPTNSYSYPSIAVNSSDDVLIGFGHHSPDKYGSASYAFRKNGDAAFSTLHRYKEGLAHYFQTFTGNSNRWGDYTTTTIDPVNDTDFWVLGEFASTSNLWHTHWAKVVPPVANSITTNAPSSVTLCVGKNYNLTFTSAGVYNAGNTFTAQLATSTAFVSPTTIGSITSTVASTITINVPNTVTPTGSYRIRVVASNPATTSSNNQNVTVIAATLSVSSSTPAPFEAVDYVNTSGSLSLSGTVNYKAGKAITLNSSPTTSVSIPSTSGNVFEAKIQTCPY